MKKIVVILLLVCSFWSLKPVFEWLRKGKEVATQEVEKAIAEKLPVESFQEEYEVFKDEIDRFKACWSGALDCTSEETRGLFFSAIRKGASLTPQILKGAWRKLSSNNLRVSDRIKVGIGNEKKIGLIDDVPAYLAKLEEGNVQYPLEVKKALKALEESVILKIGRVRYNDRLKKAGLAPVK